MKRGRPVVVSFLWVKNDAVLTHLARLGVRAFVAPDFSNRAVEALTGAGAEVYHLRSFLTDAARDQLYYLSHDKAKEVAPAVERAVAGLEKQTRWPLKQPLQPLMMSDLGNKIFEGFELVQSLCGVAERHQIRALIMNETESAECKAAALWARSTGIPTILLNHGVTLGSAYTAARQMDADTILSFGTRGGEPYIDAGFTSEIVPVGNPAWDEYPEFLATRAEIRQVADQSLNLVPGAPIVTLATTWTAKLTTLVRDSYPDDLVRTFLSAMQKLEKAGLVVNPIVKGRPAGGPDERSRVEAIAQEVGLIRYAFLDKDLAPTAAISDILVGCGSSAIIEGIMSGAVGMNVRTPADWILGPAFSALDGIIDISLNNAAGLADAVVKILSNKELATNVKAIQRARINSYIGALDGRSAERAAQAIYTRLAPISAEDRAVHSDWLGVSRVRKEVLAAIQGEPASILLVGPQADDAAKAVRSAFPQADVVPDQEEFASIGPRHHGRRFAAVVLLGAFERAEDPAAGLSSLKSLLAPAAQVCAIVPNARNLWLITDLLVGGTLAYAHDGGPLDLNNRRLFTLNGIRAIFAESGYAISAVTEIVDRRGESLEIPGAGVMDLSTDKIAAKRITPDDVRELRAADFVVSARLV